MFPTRAANRADAAPIRRLVRRGGINPLGLDWERFIVAVNEDGRVISCGQVKTHKDGSRELASIVTDPQWRGQGAARTVIERLLELHPGNLYLTCRSSLDGFYRKFGFEPVSWKEMPLYFRAAFVLVNALHKAGLLPERLLVMACTRR